MTDSPLRVAVTGASGYIGSRLVNCFQSSESVEFILAMDIRPPDIDYSDRVAFVRQDIGDPFPDLFADYRIDSVVHLAYLLNPGRRRQVSRRVNVTGSDNVLEACAAAGVRHILYFSSTSVYGAHPDNPDFLTEEHPVRPIPGFLYSEDKLESESRLAEFADRNPSVTVTILRGCPVLGPNSNNFISNAFRKPIIPTIAGADPDMQFLHEDDLVDALAACLDRMPSGTYNVAGEGTIKWSEMAATMDSRVLTCRTSPGPDSPPSPGASISRATPARAVSTSSAIAGPPTPAKLSAELGFSPKYTSAQTWDAFTAATNTRHSRARGNPQGRGTP